VSDRGDAAQQIKKRTWEAVRPSRVRQLFSEVDPVLRFRKQHEEGNRIHHAASQPGEFSNAIPPRRSRDHGTLGDGQIGGWYGPRLGLHLWPRQWRCGVGQPNVDEALGSRWVSRSCRSSCAAILFNRTKKMVTASEHCDRG